MKSLTAMAAACAAMYCSCVFASPSDYVAEPATEKGEFEIDLQSGASWARPHGNDLQSAIGIGFGYGVSEHWFTEIVPKWQRTQPGGTHPDAIEWENKFVFTEPGEYPIDLALLAEIERPKNLSDGYELRSGPLLQTHFGQWGRHHQRPFHTPLPGN